MLDLYEPSQGPVAPRIGIAHVGGIGHRRVAPLPTGRPLRRLCAGRRLRSRGASEVRFI